MQRIKYQVLMLLLLMLFVGGCNPQQQKAGLVTNNKSVQAVQNQPNTVTGRAEAGEKVKVVSKLAGKAAEVMVDMGSEVKQGQVLLRLDANDLDASVNACQATLDNAQIVLKYAEINQQRAEKLRENQALSEADYENNSASVTEKSEANVRLAQANLDKAVITCKDSIVLSPISGTVTACNVNAGELVNTQTPVVTIINLNKIEIMIYVNERQINTMQLGQTYKVEIPAIPGQTFNGKVTNISGAMDTTAKAFPVKITVENPKHLIKDGMFAKVYL